MDHNAKCGCDECQYRLLRIRFSILRSNSCTYQPEDLAKTINARLTMEAAVSRIERDDTRRAYTQRMNELQRRLAAIRREEEREVVQPPPPSLDEDFFTMIATFSNTRLEGQRSSHIPITI